MNAIIRIGTRESQLALWQANEVRRLLAHHGYQSELVFIKSEGDVDLTTPLYAMGVQGIFTRSLDIALLNNKIDLAVHSMKDVPIQLPTGIIQAAVLKRASYKDILVPNAQCPMLNNQPLTIATSSIRRKAQWLYRFPEDHIENIRGNVNTRLKKLMQSNWHGAIFAAAGLERIGLRPTDSIDLDWMLPAPAQGAILIVTGENNHKVITACQKINDPNTAIITKIERDFLHTLMGGCSSPIGAFSSIKDNILFFKGNITAPDGSKQLTIEEKTSLQSCSNIGQLAAATLCKKGAKEIITAINNESE